MLNRSINTRFRYKTCVSNAWELKQEEGIINSDTFKGHYR